MGVKLKLDRERKGKAALGLADFRHPEDPRTHHHAVLESAIIWLVVIGLVTLVGKVAHQWRIFAAVGAGWFLLSLLYFLVIARGGERREQAELIKQQKRAAMANAPEAAAARALEEPARAQARTLGAGAVNVALVDGPPDVHFAGDAIVITKGLQQQLTAEDTITMIARMLGHRKAGHVNLLQLERRVERLQPLARYTLALPAAILAQRLESWLPYANRTADRAALLLTQNHKACGSAIIKEAIARYGGQVEWREKDGWDFDEGSERSEERGIQTQELSAYLAREGEVTTEEGDMTSHYRLGEFLRQHPDVRARVAELAQFAASPAYREAVGKLAPQP
jgi:hypothetical protein